MVWIECVLRSRAAPGDPEGMVNSLLADLQRFSQSRLAGDDVTILCLGRID